MAQADGQKTSKYVKPAREQKVFAVVSVLFLFSLFVMPQYFGLPLPVFDFTLLRIMIVLLLFMIIADDQRKDAFAELLLHSRLTLVLIPYLIVISYTMVLRADINAFLNPFIEILSLYLLVYIIQNELGVIKTLRILIVFIYLLAILGIVEYVMGRSPFSYLETIKGIYTGQFIRSGNYRIMGPCNHSLGYGLMLMAVIPFACIDYEKNQINLLHRPVLLLLLVGNVFLTGSRSTLAICFFELLLLFIFSSRENKNKFLLVFAALIGVLAVFLIVGHNTGIARYILLQFASILDTVLGTSYADLFGGNSDALSSSSNYREQLKYIFTVRWLNPFLGIGRKRSFQAEINGSYIQSVDNFYIAEYIRYAYPGLIAYVIFLGHYLIGIVRKCFASGGALYKGLFIGALCYLINLLWVDSLQTLKYLYVLFALFICLEKETPIAQQEISEKSKYIKDKRLKWI